MIIEFNLIFIKEENINRVRHDIKAVTEGNSKFPSKIKDEEVLLPTTLLATRSKQFTKYPVEILAVENFAKLDQATQIAFIRHAEVLVPIRLEVKDEHEYLHIDIDDICHLLKVKDQHERNLLGHRINDFLVESEAYMEFIANISTKTFTFILGDKFPKEHKVITKMTFAPQTNRFTHAVSFREVEGKADTNYDLFVKGKEKKWITRIEHRYEIDHYSNANYLKAVKELARLIEVMTKNYILPEYEKHVDPIKIINEFSAFWKDCLPLDPQQ